MAKAAARRRRAGAARKGVCEQCGSIQIARSRASVLDKFIAAVSSRRSFVCRRCGWRARRDWTTADLERPEPTRAGAEFDPSLVALDQATNPSPNSTQKSSIGGNDATRTPLDSFATQVPAIDASDTTSFWNETTRASTPSNRGLRRSRERARRREVIATVWITALTVFMTAMLLLTGSCNTGGPV